MKKILITTCILSTYLLANDFAIEELLLNIEKKSDLSQKTKLANSGVSFIYTRDDINRLQIKNLADILKSSYSIGYKENRFGMPDPFTFGKNHINLSSNIRVFIDNQEITSGMHGSGLVSVGNLNIEWVDHVEIYTQSPTYEYAVESTTTLIKLYSKSAKKDEGGKVLISHGSYNSSVFNAYHAQELDKWSYFAFVSKEKANRKKHDNLGQEISRNGDINFLLATFNKDNQNILFSSRTQDRDSFLDISADGTPTSSTIDSNFIHIGYDNKIGNLFFLLSYEYLKMKSKVRDNVNAISQAPFYGLYPISKADTFTSTDTFTGEIKYKFKKNSHHFTSGLKLRKNLHRYDKAVVNDIVTAQNNTNTQTTSTIYIEDQYNIKDNSILTAGIQYSYVKNSNATQQKDNMTMYRLGHTFTTNNFTFKTIASHTLMTLDPYLVDSSLFLQNPKEHYKPQEYNTFVENIIYKKGSHKYELILDYKNIKNYLFSDAQGKLYSSKKDIQSYGINTRYTKEYNKYDKFLIDLAYNQFDNTIIDEKENNLKLYSMKLQNINTYGKFDIFNELLYSRNNFEKENNFDYSAGVKYNYSEDFIVSIKGTNLFNKAAKTSYERISSNALSKQEPIKISPIDKKIMLSMEYFF